MKEIRDFSELGQWQTKRSSINTCANILLKKTIFSPTCILIIFITKLVISVFCVLQENYNKK